MMRRRGGGWGNQANDARDDDERFSTTSSSSSFGLNTKNTKTKKTTLTTKKKRILTMRRLVAMIIAVLALVQILVLVGITLSMEEDDDTHVAWTAEHAWTKSTPGNIIFAKRRRRSKTNKKKRTTMMMMKEEEEENENGTVVFEDVARDVDMSPRYEEKMKLNPFGYVYWHRDRGEGVVNWHASLAEVMRFARAHRRTIVSPCARNGSLKPCVYDTDDASSLRTSTCRTKRVGCRYPRKRTEKDLEAEEDLSSDVMRPMTLAQYYDEGRLRSYVDDIVSYEQFAERFFERIKDDKRGEEGEKLGTNDVNDDKETWKKKKKRKRRNIARTEWIAVATIAFYRKNRCASHPRRKNSTTKTGHL